MKPIYLDYNATTPIDHEVAEVMKPYLEEFFGNPSSSHWYGIRAKKAIEIARSQVADLLGCQPDEIIFTSGGSESNNYAIKGVTFANRIKGNHIITSAIEHPAVTEVCKYLETKEFRVTYLPVDEYGLVDIVKLQETITPQTILISLMHANNEVGTIQNIKKISEIAKQNEILFHRDGVATAGIIPVDVSELGMDAYSFSSQQMYGPKGAAALYLKKGVRLKPMLQGGIQERGRRAGTENIPAIVGFGRACEIAKNELDKNAKHISSIRDKLVKGIIEKIDKVKLNGHPSGRIPGSAHISFEYIEGESILLMLNMEGIFAASGSSCASQALKSSYVLIEMGLSSTMAQGSISFSLGKYNTEAEVDRTVGVLPPIIERLRKMSPLFKE
ncbi:MAG: IscS subfamily cysteine desulfurase [Deltaproteobacteria bacterium]|nr:IscS subfamily cysteine desulfurase [Deltaproteobacteria bacterium]